MGRHMAENNSTRVLDFTELNRMAAHVHELNYTWWHDLDTGERLTRNVGELLMLIVSEIAEAMEGHRKGLLDDKLITRSMVEVELADTIIRILDFAGAYNLDVGGAVRDKLEFNKNREDHKPEVRKQPGGKKY